MINTCLQYLLYLVVLVALAIPLGAYIAKVMNGEKTLFTKVLVPCEKVVYKIMGV
ncbi:MAG: potassium-transporting ATPase subunit KdpA, partial [Oscillospiraceae bacterium]